MSRNQTNALGYALVGAAGDALYHDLFVMGVSLFIGAVAVFWSVWDMDHGRS